MKNIKSRDEYLQSVEEGFIKDTIKKGIDKVKSFFRIGMKKIKNFIAIFDKDGNVFPVVSPQAVIDKYSDSSAIKVYAPKSLSDSVVDAGGNGCESDAPFVEDKEDDGVPTGKEFAKWYNDKKFKDTIEYRNMMSIPKIVKEHYDGLSDEDKKVFEEMMTESWEGVRSNRVKYSTDDSLTELAEITAEEYEDILNTMIKDWSVNDGRMKVRADGKKAKPMRNLLVFGAPGIGKSTIPNMVIRKYNESKSDANAISLISINCALIQEGDFTMPTMPQPTDVVKSIQKFSKAFPQSNEYIEGLDDEQQEKLAQSILSSGQFKAADAPKSWLPSYKETGDDAIDSLLNAYANGGVYEDEDGRTHRSGGGGFILFDEFLRAPEGVFDQLMNFYLDRRIQDWKLGSKWAIIACSNRPYDDGRVADVWSGWNDGPAAKDRMANVVHMKTDPEAWKAWAKKNGCDQLILDFIFEDKNGDDEYPRWHSIVRNGSGDSAQVKPVTPRRWEDVFCAISGYEIDHDLNDMSQMPEDAIKRIFDMKFDKSFTAEFMGWLRDHMDSVDLDGIMANPKDVYLPAKFVDDPSKSGVLIQNILRELKKRFKDSPEDLTDDMLANIFVWLGTYFKGDATLVNGFRQDLINDIFPEDGSTVSLSSHIKAMQTLVAAFPMRDIEDDCDYFEHPENYTDDDNVKDEVKKYAWPEGSIEILKDIMREHFPWRISGDKIKFYDELDVD